MVERFNGRISDVLRTNRSDRTLDLEQTLMRYVHLYNTQLPQSALGSRTPMQGMKDWHKSHPHLVVKTPHIRPGRDLYPDGDFPLIRAGGTQHAKERCREMAIWASSGILRLSQSKHLRPRKWPLSTHTTTAVVMAACLQLNRPAVEAKLTKAAACRGIAGGFDRFWAGDGALNAMFNMPKGLGAMGVQADRIGELTATTLECPSVGGNPVPMTKQNTLALFEAAM